MQEQQENVSKETETVKKNQTELLELNIWTEKSRVVQHHPGPITGKYKHTVSGFALISLKNNPIAHILNFEMFSFPYFFLTFKKSTTSACHITYLCSPDKWIYHIEQ